MLMVFTRSKNSRFYAFFRRLFGRGKGEISSKGMEADLGSEPAIAFPKAAE
jgi:multidrug efflux pump